MRAGVIAALLLVATAVIPIASAAAELQVSAASEAASKVTVVPSAGAGVDADTSGTESTSTAKPTNATTQVPSEYYTLASNLTQSLCDALSKGSAAVIDYFRGQLYREMKPENLVGVIVLSAFKTVLNSYFHSESFQKPLNEFHLKLVQIIGPNVSIMQLLSTVMGELQENLKEAIKSFGPIATFYDTIENAYKNASNDKAKSAYDSAKSDLDDMVESLSKYVSDIFCMILSKFFPFEISIGSLS
ncbi:hypothetical protein [Methanopyrus sp.]